MGAYRKSTYQRQLSASVRECRASIANRIDQGYPSRTRKYAGLSPASPTALHTCTYSPLRPAAVRSHCLPVGDVHGRLGEVLGRAQNVTSVEGTEDEVNRSRTSEEIGGRGQGVQWTPGPNIKYQLLCCKNQENLTVTRWQLPIN